MSQIKNYYHEEITNSNTPDDIDYEYEESSKEEYLEDEAIYEEQCRQMEDQLQEEAEGRKFSNSLNPRI